MKEKAREVYDANNNNNNSNSNTPQGERRKRGERGGDRATGPYRNYFTIPLFDGSREGKVRLC